MSTHRWRGAHAGRRRLHAVEHERGQHRRPRQLETLAVARHRPAVANVLLREIGLHHANRVARGLEAWLRFSERRESRPGGERLAALLAAGAQMLVHLCLRVLAEQSPHQVHPLRR